MLDVPERGRLFLISPPASPPLGWSQIRENSPVSHAFAHHWEDFGDLKLEDPVDQPTLSFVPPFSVPEHNAALPAIVINRADGITVSRNIPKTQMPPSE